MAEMASAPPSAAALAMVAMFVTLGVSLAMIGTLEAARQPATTRRHISGSTPKSTPWLTLGHEMFNSMAATPAHAFEPRGHFDELIERAAGDADDDRRTDRGQIRQMMFDKRFEAVVVQADAVEHAGGGFDRSPRRVAGPRLLGDRFGNDAAEALQIDQAGHFPCIAERARGRQDWIGQFEAAKLDREVGGSGRGWHG